MLNPSVMMMDRYPGYLLISLLLAVATFSTFWPTVHNEFVNLDDPQMFLRNGLFQQPGWDRLAWMLTTFHMGGYQPLGWLIWSVQHAFGGMDPLVYHLGSVVLHTANTVVLFLLIASVLRLAAAPATRQARISQLIWSGWAALLFAVHPLRAEPVSWISSQSYLPASLFFTLALLAYLQTYHKESGTRARGWWIASLAAFILAVMCKAVAMTLPLVLLVLDFYPLGRFRKARGRQRRWGQPAGHLALEKLPFFAVSAVTGLLAVLSKQHGEALRPLSSEGFMPRLAHAGYSMTYYLFKTVVPGDLNPFVAMPGEINWRDGPFLLGLLATLFISVGLVCCRRRWPAALAAWACYGVILLPHSGLVSFGPELVADRYSYLSTMSGVVLLAGALNSLGGVTWTAVVAWLVSLATALGLGARTREQLGFWHTSARLWTRVLEFDADCAMAHALLGEAYIETGTYEEAELELLRAIELDPLDKVSYYNLGYLYLRQGRLEEGQEELGAALDIDPEYVNAHYNLGISAMNQGDYVKAIERMKRILEIEPTFVRAYVSLGDTYYNMRVHQRARRCYHQALKLDPRNTHAREMLARLD